MQISSSFSVYKRWFTLIELVIVLAIVALLFSVTIKLSRGNIANVEVRQEKEDFIATYYDVLLNNLTSKYHGDTIYTGVVVHFEKGATGITYTFIWNTTATLDRHTFRTLSIGDISIQDTNNKYKEIASFSIILSPQEMWCEILLAQEKVTEDTIQFTLTAQKSTKKYCFSFEPFTCKLKECENKEWH